MGNYSFSNDPDKKPKEMQNPEPQPGQETPLTTEQLLPALLALNIRQARAEGQPDLAQTLQSLQLSLQVKTETENEKTE